MHPCVKKHLNTIYTFPKKLISHLPGSQQHLRGVSCSSYLSSARPTSKTMERGKSHVVGRFWTDVSPALVPSGSRKAAASLLPTVESNPRNDAGMDPEVCRNHRNKGPARMLRFCVASRLLAATHWPRRFRELSHRTDVLAHCSTRCMRHVFLVSIYRLEVLDTQQI